jgi:hypothetical protein
MGLGLYVSVAMDFQLKDGHGVVNRSARNEFQKVATTGLTRRSAKLLMKILTKVNK